MAGSVLHNKTYSQPQNIKQDKTIHHKVLGTDYETFTSFHASEGYVAGC